MAEHHEHEIQYREVRQLDNGRMMPLQKWETIEKGATLEVFTSHSSKFFQFRVKPESNK